MSEVVVATPSSSGVITDSEIDRLHRLASAAALSKSLGVTGVYDQQVASIFTRMFIGRGFGITPEQALAGAIYVFDGKVQLASTFIAAAVRERGYDFKVTEHTDEACTIEFYDKDGSRRGQSRFTLAEAKNANLTNKKNWQQWPRNMLFARAMSNGVKWYVPEAMGGMPVYSEGDDLSPLNVENLADGHGDGSDPGWGTVAPSLSHRVDKLVKRANKTGYPGVGNITTVKMELNHKSPAEVEAWITETTKGLVEFQKSEAEVADAEVVEEKEA